MQYSVEMKMHNMEMCEINKLKESIIESSSPWKGEREWLMLNYISGTDRMTTN